MTSLSLLGTWKLTKCEPSRPDLPHPSSGVTTFTQEPDGIHYTAASVWSDGRETKASAVLNLDGAFYPVTGSLLTDLLSLVSLEDGSYQAKMRKGGVDTGTNHATVSTDGTTMAGHWEIATPAGSITWDTTSERV